MLAASNLGFKYLDAGMGEEAKELLSKAIKEGGTEAEMELGRCMSALKERETEERKKYEELLDKVKPRRDFFAEAGKAFMEAAPPQLSGKWKLPFGSMDIVVTDVNVDGHATIGRRTLKTLGTNPFLSADTNLELEEYKLSGKLTGRLCKFGLDVTNSSNQPSMASLLGGAQAERKGYIVFLPSGVDGLYIETGPKIQDPKPISKITVPTT